MPLPKSNRCLFGCETTGHPMHKFPNPVRCPEIFKTWVKLGGECLKNMTNEEIFKIVKVCDIHFIQEHRNRNNRLSAIAVPTLYISPPKGQNLLEAQSDGIGAVNNDTIIEKDVRTYERTKTENYCDVCQQHISGFRYMCVQCEDYDLCSSCVATLIHPQHYMLRVPGQRPLREVKIIIKEIRRKLEILEAELKNNGRACQYNPSQYWDVEIKKEEGPFEVTIMETVQHRIEDTNPESTSHHREIPDVTNQVHIKGNTNHSYNSASKHSNNLKAELNDENQTERNEENVHDSIVKEWYDESLLDINDYVDNDRDTDEKETLQDLTDDVEVDISYNSRVNKKQNRNILLHTRTHEVASNRTSALQGKDELIGLSALNVLDPNSDVTSKEYSKTIPETMSINMHSEYIDTSNTQQSHSVKEIPARLVEINKSVYLDIELNDVRQSSGLLTLTATSKPIDKINNIQLSHSDKEIPVHLGKRKTSVCLSKDIVDNMRQSPGLLTQTTSKTTDKIRTIQLSDSDDEIPVHPSKRKTNVCLNKEILDDVRQSPELIKQTAYSKTTHKIRSIKLSDSDDEIPVHPAKRKTSVCLNKEILNDVRQSPGLLPQAATSKTIDIISDIRLSHSDKRILVSPGNRKTSACFNKELLNDLRQLPAATSKAIGKSTKGITVNSAAGKRLKLCGLDNRRVEESVIVVD